MSRPVIDILNASAVDAVKKSGLAVETARMATVTALNTDGTLNAQAGPDSFPRVRMLSAYLNPAVGDVVEIMNTSGGWVCLGKLAASPAPRIQSGKVSTPAPGQGGGVTSATVTFPRPFASPPRIVLTGESTVPQNFSIAVQGPATAGFVAQCYRSTNSSTTFHWIATDL